MARRLVSVLMAAALAGGCWGFTSVWPLGDAAGSATSPSTPDPSSVLAVVTSAHGTLHLRGLSGTLALTGVSDRPVWFTDRPQRAAGAYSMAQFRETFFGKQQPPNAALDVSGADASRDVVIVELSDPTYASASHSLRFHAKVIDPSRDLGPNSQLRWEATRADPAVGKSFGANALFVDSAAGDDTAQCLVPEQQGYILDMVSIDCLDAQTVVDMTDLTVNCYGNAQYFNIPNFGVWQCSGSAGQAVIWLSPVTNNKFPDARFTMYPCSQNPPACTTQ